MLLWMRIISCLTRAFPPKMPRYLLPNAAETKIVITMNIRELLHFLSLRCCNRAQWEIRELANRMLELVRPYGALHLYGRRRPLRPRGLS